MSRPKTWVGATVLTVALALSSVATVSAELVAHGDLFVNFKGGLAPKVLPRHSLAPITVWIDGTVRTLSGEAPPALRGIRIELNRHGKLDVEGLPTCPKERIASTNDVVALRRCGDAQVGSGGFFAASDYPEQGEFPSAGKILAFNGKEGGKPVIYAHVYGTRPLESTRIITFRISRRGGAYGTVLAANLPAALNPKGFIKNISLRLHRNYRYRGQQHSYLSAGCPAPSGFTAAVFPFARASMTFSDGRGLSGTMTRTCRARG
jgi:hypothetical protein